MRFLLGFLIIATLLYIAALVYVAFGVPMPTLGITSSQLQPCPDSPNCVSTQATVTDAEHFMAAIPYTGDTTFVMTQLLKVISATPRSTIIKKDDSYLHAEFRSRVFRFVDDVEFYLDDTNKLIHFRSASRLGKGDMGVNRKRMTELTEKIRASF
jgi:uncharacterized protein (DUF1499 family)